MEKNKRKKVKYNKKYNILIAIAGLILVIYILVSIIKLITAPTDVFIIEYGEVSLEEQSTGIIIREETVVKGDNYQNGLIAIKTEGEKVSKGDAIFRYQTDNEKEIVQHIQEINIKLDEALKNQNNAFSSSDIKALDNQIEQKIEGLSTYTDTEKIKEYKNDINTYLTKKSKIAGKNSPSGSYIKQLYDERNLYEDKLNQTTEYIKAPTSGVVSYRTDNLENILTTTDFSKLNKALLGSLNIKTGQIIATNDKEGKIINNYECYIATIMDTESARNSEEGQSVKIRLASNDEIKAKIVYKAQVEDDDTLLVLKITNKVEDLISYRKISFDIIWWSDTGLKVPNSSIIYDDNDNAYIIRNRAGYFDKILIKKLRETKNYTLVKNFEITELKAKGYSTEEIKNIKNVSLYDEIVSKPRKEMLQ